MRFMLSCFWFLALPVGLILTWQVWIALKGLVHERLFDRAAAVRFTLIVACLFTIPPLVLGVLQQLGEYDLPNYPYAFAVNEPYAFAGWLVMVGFYLVVIAWVWLGKPATVLALFARRIGKLPENVLLIKVIVTALAIVGVAIATFMPPKILGWR